MPTPGTSRRICNMHDAESLLCECVTTLEIREMGEMAGEALTGTTKGKNIFIQM